MIVLIVQQWVTVSPKLFCFLPNLIYNFYIHENNLLLDLLGRITTVEGEINRLKRQQAELSSRLKILESERDELKSRYNLERSKRESERDWTAETFAWAAQARRILQERFHLTGFRHKQLSAINATLSKKDVLVLMPTGERFGSCRRAPESSLKTIHWRKVKRIQVTELEIYRHVDSLEYK